MVYPVWVQQVQESDRDVPVQPGDGQVPAIFGRSGSSSASGDPAAGWCGLLSEAGARRLCGFLLSAEEVYRERRRKVQRRRCPSKPFLWTTHSPDVVDASVSFEADFFGDSFAVGAFAFSVPLTAVKPLEGERDF